MDKTCCPQYTIKCDVTNFKLSKSHKKVIKRNNKYFNNDSKPGSGGLREGEEDLVDGAMPAICDIPTEKVEAGKLILPGDIDMSKMPKLKGNSPSERVKSVSHEDTMEVDKSSQPSTSPSSQGATNVNNNLSQEEGASSKKIPRLGKNR